MAAGRERSTDHGILWLLAGVATAAAAVFSLCVGIAFGIALHWNCASVYKRSVDDEVARARDKAYIDHLAKLDEEAKRQKALGAQELPQDRDEAEANFEQSLAVMYPNDPKIQEALKKARRDKITP